jgi:hypothetical protein
MRSQRFKILEVSTGGSAEGAGLTSGRRRSSARFMPSAQDMEMQADQVDKIAIKVLYESKETRRVDCTFGTGAGRRGLRLRASGARAGIRAGRALCAVMTTFAARMNMSGARRDNPRRGVVIFVSREAERVREQRGRLPVLLETECVAALQGYRSRHQTQRRKLIAVLSGSHGRPAVCVAGEFSQGCG